MIQNEEQHIALHHRFVAPEAKVLVVDDNAMNLKVMARILLPYQIKVTMAGSGQEALEKLDTMEFDCVFLDHMMPEMDGVETLHRIRRKPGSYFQSLSIIAFTANAIGGAREMFLAEGFDDFIAKPIELSVLERMLRRYISEPSARSDFYETFSAKPSGTPSESTKTEKASETKAAVNDSEALADLERAGLDIQQGMTYCGDKEGFRDIVLIYHSEGAKRKASLEESFQMKDWKNYVITVHALKSNSRGIGANELADLALNLEMAGKENRIDYIFENHDELMDKHNPFLYPDGFAEEEEKTEETEATAEITGETESSQSEESPLEQIALLEERLDSFESDGLDEILELLSGMAYQGESLKGLTEEIREKVSDFDFPAASDQLEEWKKSNGL